MAGGWRGFESLGMISRIHSLPMRVGGFQKRHPSGRAIFWRRRGKQKRMALIERNCSWCGKLFQAQSWEVNRGRGKYCSISCKSQYGRSLQDQRGLKNPAWRNGGAGRYAHVLAYRAKHPDKYKAHKAVSQAIASRCLVKQPCERCGEVKVQAHHDDYAKPLDVRWLCKPCHEDEHHSAAA